MKRFWANLWAILALVTLFGCTATEGRTYYIDDSLTPEQRQMAYDVGMAWNARVGINGIRNDFVDDPADADTIVSTRSKEWLTNAINQWCDGVYIRISGEDHIVVRADAVNFRRIMDHEFGHSLGMMDHLPAGQAGLMDGGATQEWGENDIRYCREKKVCQ